jgi:hypothetical protein
MSVPTRDRALWWRQVAPIIALLTTVACAGVSADAPTVTREELTKRLVAGSSWKGEFGPSPNSGTLSVRFAVNDGTLTGELISIEGRTTAKPGSLGVIWGAGDTISFNTPGSIVRNDLRLKGNRLEGHWYGTMSGWLSLSPSVPLQ